MRQTINHVLSSYRMLNQPPFTFLFSFFSFFQSLFWCHCQAPVALASATQLLMAATPAFVPLQGKCRTVWESEVVHQVYPVQRFSIFNIFISKPTSHSKSLSNNKQPTMHLISLKMTEIQCIFQPNSPLSVGRILAPAPCEHVLQEMLLPKADSGLPLKR